MPLATLRPCRWPGCPALVERGYCAQHRPPAELAAPRRSAAIRGYGRRWREAARQFLREFPLCRCCEEHGQPAAATVVDHIVPHCGKAGLFWDRSNWQPLCKRCHDRKTASEDGGFGRLPKAA